MIALQLVHLAQFSFLSLCSIFQETTLAYLNDTIMISEVPKIIRTGKRMIKEILIGVKIVIVFKKYCSHYCPTATYKKEQSYDDASIFFKTFARRSFRIGIHSESAPTTSS